MNNQKMYGWVSQKALAQNRSSSLYLTPSGEKVQVTVVGENPNRPSSMFGDEVFVGELVLEK